jgi:hypothetical protein
VPLVAPVVALQRPRQRAAPAPRRALLAAAAAAAAACTVCRRCPSRPLCRRRLLLLGQQPQPLRQLETVPPGQPSHEAGGQVPGFQLLAGRPGRPAQVRPDDVLQLPAALLGHAPGVVLQRHGRMPH